MLILLNCKAMDSINFLSRRGVYNIDMNRAFRTAVECGKIEIAELLLEISAARMPPHMPERSDEEPQVQVGSSGTRPHSGDQARESAAPPPKSRLEFDLDFDKGDNAESCLKVAIIKGSTTIVQLLLQQEVIMNKLIENISAKVPRFYARRSLFYLARDRGHKDIEKLLMEYEMMLKRQFKKLPPFRL